MKYPSSEYFFLHTVSSVIMLSKASWVGNVWTNMTAGMITRFIMSCADATIRCVDEFLVNNKSFVVHKQNWSLEVKFLIWKKNHRIVWTKIMDWIRILIFHSFKILCDIIFAFKLLHGIFIISSKLFYRRSKCDATP